MKVNISTTECMSSKLGTLVRPAVMAGGVLLLTISTAAAQSNFCTTTGGTLTPAFSTEPAMLERNRSVLDTTFGAAGRTGGEPSERLFSFKRTIGALLTSANMTNNPANREALVRTMFDTLSSNNNPPGDAQVNRESGVMMPVDDRPAERALSAAALLDENSDVGLVPVGLFNRLDLAPTDWAHCGEYRIVYARRNPPSFLARFFLIFEAAAPNPEEKNSDPMAREQGCRRIAEFWAGLKDVSDTTERARRLAALYFEGQAGDKPLPGPIIDFQNLGGNGVRGQVRSNQFLNSTPWQLREFLVQRTFLSSPNGLAFVPNPVNDNPLAELYRDDFVSNAALRARNPEALLLLLQGQFLQRFSSQSFLNLVPETTEQHDKLVSGLARFNLGNPAVTPDSIVLNTVGLGDTDMFDEYQSSSDPVDKVSNLAGDNIRRLISALLRFPTGSAIGRSVDEVALLNRAGAVTCGGCHQTAALDRVFSVNASATVWPRALPFVHIDEAPSLPMSNISEALSQHFLPFRRYVMARYLCGDGTPAAPAAAAALASSTPLTVAQSPLRSMRLSVNALEGLRSSAGGASASAAAATSLANAAVPAETASAAFLTVQSTVNRARSLEQRVPGAFVQTRRPH